MSEHDDKARHSELIAALRLQIEKMDALTDSIQRFIALKEAKHDRPSPIPDTEIRSANS